MIRGNFVEEISLDTYLARDPTCVHVYFTPHVFAIVYCNRTNKGINKILSRDTPLVVSSESYNGRKLLRAYLPRRIQLPNFTLLLGYVV